MYVSVQFSGVVQVNYCVLELTKSTKGKKEKIEKNKSNITKHGKLNG